MTMKQLLNASCSSPPSSYSPSSSSSCSIFLSLFFTLFSSRTPFYTRCNRTVPLSSSESLPSSRICSLPLPCIPEPSPFFPPSLSFSAQSNAPSIRSLFLLSPPSSLRSPFTSLSSPLSTLRSPAHLLPPSSLLPSLFFSGKVNIRPGEPRCLLCDVRYCDCTWCYLPPRVLRHHWHDSLRCYPKTCVLCSVC